MNFVETTLPKKHPGARVAYAEYPKNLKKPDGSLRVVNSEEEEDAAVAQGWSEKPMLINQTPNVTAQMSTLSAAQDSYNALKNQYDASVTEFNTKYSALRDKHNRLQENYDVQKMSIEQLEKDLELAKRQNKGLLTERMGLLKEKEAAKAASTSGRVNVENVSVTPEVATAQG